MLARFQRRHKLKQTKTTSEVSDEQSALSTRKNRRSVVAANSLGAKPATGGSSHGGGRDDCERDSARPDPPPTTGTARRKSTALADKSNQTQRKQGALRNKSAVSTLATAPATRTASRAAGPSNPIGSPSRIGTALHVYRDSSATSTGAPQLAPSPARRPSLPLTDFPARRPRPPRRLIARHASEPPTTLLGDGRRPALSTQALPRSPTASSQQQHPTGGTARSSRLPQFLVPPNQAAETQPLAKPAPWALSTPAAPGLQHSSSPTGPATEGLPVFQFTTTEFGDLPSLQLEPAIGGRGGCGGDRKSLLATIDGDVAGEGMDSTIMLETWDDSASASQPAQTSPMMTGRVAAEEEELVEPSDGNTTIKANTSLRDAVGEVEAHAEGDDGDSTVRGAPSEGDPQQEETRGMEEPEQGGVTNPADASMISPEPVEATASGETVVDNEVGEIGGVSQHSQGSTQTEEAVIHGPVPDPPAETPTVEETRPKAKRHSTEPLHYTSSFLPPRHPRWPTDDSLPDGPPSSEDELAYYLRTTGTFSSEDDLPVSDEAPSDESAKEDWLAEREVGRAVKASSRQREKRVAAYDQARSSARLRVGDGVGGRRKEWKREILPLDQVRLPRLMREAIEAKAMELGEVLADVKVEGAEVSALASE